MKLENVSLRRGMPASVLMSLYFKDDPIKFGAALSSIFESTMVPDQVILVVDGPITVGLQNVINDFQKYNELEVYYLEKNVGLAAALNHGLSRVRFDIIFRCDADDLNHKDRFEVQFEYLKRQESVSVVGGQIDEYDENWDYIATRKVPTDLPEIKKLCKYRNPLNHQTVAIRTAALKRVGGYPLGTIFKEDYVLWIRLLGNGVLIKNLDRVLVDVSAGKSFMCRRGGFFYALGEIRVQKELILADISNLSLAVGVFVVKAALYVSPKPFLAIFYKLALRSSRK